MEIIMGMATATTGTTTITKAFAAEIKQSSRPFFSGRAGRALTASSEALKWLCIGENPSGFGSLEPGTRVQTISGFLERPTTYGKES